MLKEYIENYISNAVSAAIRFGDAEWCDMEGILDRARKNFEAKARECNLSYSKEEYNSLVEDGLYKIRMAYTRNAKTTGN